MRLIIAALTILALTGCAALDAAHIEGQKQDAKKYTEYSDVELQKQTNVETCFNRATNSTEIAMCAMLGMGTGMASTFGGRPTITTIAPTTGQVIQGTVQTLAPYGAAASIANSVSKVQAKDPIITEQPAPVIVRPEVVRPEVVNPVSVHP